MAIMYTLTCFTVIGLFLSLPRPGHAHGRLWDPPARGTMWRQGFNTPINYNDNEMFCGGFARQVRNGYKCGVCGDPWDGTRLHEAGGMYATGQISRTYARGQMVNIEVQITANHKGYFEFRLCPVNNPYVKATEACLDQNLLQMADGSGTKYHVTTEMGNAMMSIGVLLPPYLTCQQCVLQWRYHTGNSWGTNPDGTGCLGCGQQEEFYGCADIQIRNSYSGSNSGDEVAVTYGVTNPPTTTSGNSGSSSNNNGNGGGNSSSSSSNNNGNGGGNISSSSSNNNNGNGGGNSSSSSSSSNGNGGGSSSSSSSNSGNGGSGSYNGGNNGGGSVSSSNNNSNDNNNGGWGSSGTNNGGNTACHGVGGRSDLDSWCELNCGRGYCPSSTCACQTGNTQSGQDQQVSAGCRAVGVYASLPGYHTWCVNNCAGGYCPSSFCTCS